MFCIKVSLSAKKTQKLQKIWKKLRKTKKFNIFKKLKVSIYEKYLKQDTSIGKCDSYKRLYIVYTPSGIFIYACLI